MATELQNLSNIFNNRLFRIPDFQRGYAWGERQLIDFWSDLNRVGKERTHYCGQLTLEKAAENQWRKWEGDEWLMTEAGYEPYFVVDGQQRLTTSIILIQCLLKGLDDNSWLAGQTVADHRTRYLAKRHVHMQSCLFGYARDNPSHEYFRTQILGVPSNDYQGIFTVYTTNLGAAKTFFNERLKRIDDDERERLLKALVQRFRFNLHELTEDIDVFVAFETMNNRGKSLSRLELLKNRLIYLSTLANAPESERDKVRNNVNSVWRTIYEELGRNPSESLDDDEFLRSHWIVFFGYDKDEADPLTRFLLNHHFTPERLESGELGLSDIQAYVDNLQVCARVWQQLNFPDTHSEKLGDAAQPLARIKRLGFGVLQPLLLSTLATDGNQGDKLETLRQAERFLVLVRSLNKTRSDIAGPDSYRMAHEIAQGRATVRDAAEMLRHRVDQNFKTSRFQDLVDDLYSESKGFYSLNILKFLLYEFEEFLRIGAKASEQKISWSDFRGSKKSVEHVYPQEATDKDWPAFANFTTEQKHYLKHSLGNLVAVSIAKNASMSRSSFQMKKVGTTDIPGFSQGSFSELRIAHSVDWTATEILARGIAMLDFIETRWGVSLGDHFQKCRILKLEFVDEKIAT